MHITYLFDPLCGWCYGAGPAIEKLAKLSKITIELAPTGLFAGEGARSMDERFSDFAWQNDRRIGQLTGQAFSQVYRDQVLGSIGSMFNSAPATLGIVAVGLTQPDKEREALKVLQAARYIHGRNNSEMTVVADALDEAGFRDAAVRVLASDDTLLGAYRKRIEKARNLMTEFRLDGVPAILVGDDDKRRMLKSGVLYGDFDLLAAELWAG